MYFRSFEVSPLDCNLSLQFRPSFNEINGLKFKRSFSGNDPHIIYIPNSDIKDLIHIHLCGTASKANEDSKEFLKSSVMNENLITIGLNYEWGEPDLTRVERCESIADTSNEALDIMDKFHENIVMGSKDCTCGLIDIDSSSTIVKRIKDLILYLILHDITNSSIWKSLLINNNSNESNNNDNSDLTDIDWKRIILSGHSQGAGHAAWLAQRASLHTLVLLSGPQEGGEHLDLLSSHWLDRPCLAGHVRCLKHKQEEGRNNQMIESSVTRIFNSTTFTVADIDIDRDICFKTDTVFSLSKISGGGKDNGECILLRSDVSPAVVSHPGPRPNHMSTCLDVWTPKYGNEHDEEIEKERGTDIRALYTRWVWGYLLLGIKCSASAVTSISTSRHSSL